MEIWWELVGDETVLTGAGLLQREFRGNDLQVATASFQPTSSEPEWAADAWNPAPVPHSVAQIKDVTAYVATFSRMVVIGVRTPGDVTWSTVRDNPAALAATALGRLRNRDALEPLVRTAKDKEPRVRAAVATAQPRQSSFS